MKNYVRRTFNSVFIELKSKQKLERYSLKEKSEKEGGILTAKAISIAAPFQNSPLMWRRGGKQEYTHVCI